MRRHALIRDASCRNQRWELHAVDLRWRGEMIPRRCGLLKKEASIVCHGASGEKLCCASKQEHCPSAAWKSDFRTRHSARPRRHAHNRCPRAGCIYDEGSIKPLFITTLVVVIILGLFLMLQCWRWSRPEPSPLRASSAAPPPEPEPVAPVAQAEIVPYPNR